MRRASGIDLFVKNWKDLFFKLGVIRVCKDVTLCHKGHQNFPHLEIPFQWVESQDSVVSIVARIGAGRSVVRIPAGTTKYSLLHLTQAIPGVHPDPYPICTRSFQGVKRPERNFDYTPLPSAEVMTSTAFGCVLKICESGEEIQLAKNRG